MQWKLPASLSSFVQQAGRAACGAGRVGLAVLLVEKSVYSADLSNVSQPREDRSQDKKKRKRTVRQSAEYLKGEKGHASAHGVGRGSYGGKSDTVHQQDVLIDFDAIDKGLYSLAQTSSCQQAFLTKIYQNQDAGAFQLE